MRGLTPFTESERNLFVGRESEVDDLSKLIRSEYFRAGLLYGPAGVGKSSLLNAGVIPHLREHGVVVAVCEPYCDPLESFVFSIGHSTGLRPREGEDHLTFLARIVSEAPQGQLYLFVVDDCDVALSRKEWVVALGDAYARVVTRSSGKARFLFSCASDRVFTLTALERRTGSIFPANCRFELKGLDQEIAGRILASQLPQGSDPGIVHDVVSSLDEQKGVSPAELQLACLAIRDLKISSIDDVRKWGGARALGEKWIEQVTGHTDSPGMSRRVLSIIAASETGWYRIVDIAEKLKVPPALVSQLLTGLYQFGLVQVLGNEQEQTHASLAHPVLRERISRVAQPSVELATDLRNELQAKAQRKGRVASFEVQLMEQEAILPQTEEEKAVLSRSVRFRQIVVGASIGAPLLLLVVIFVAMNGAHYYEYGTNESGSRVLLVKDGRNGFFENFHWMGFGDVVAETGLTRANTQPKTLASLNGENVGSDYGDKVLDSMRPDLRASFTYLRTNDLDPLLKLTDGPDKHQALETLARLAPGEEELDMVRLGLSDSDPLVRKLSLQTALAGARRNNEKYLALLRSSANSGDALVAGSVRQGLSSLPASVRVKIISSGEQQTGPAKGRSELVALQAKSVSSRARDKAKQALIRGIRRGDQNLMEHAIELAGSADVAVEDRLWLLETLAERGTKEKLKEIKSSIDPITKDGNEKIQSAAWALLAVADPSRMGVDLVSKVKEDPSDEERDMWLPAWGYLARSGDDAALAAFDKMLKDASDATLAKYAPYYGFVGRPASGKLAKIAKGGGSSGRAATQGLVNSVARKGSRYTALKPLRKMWKRKGRERHRAARMMVDLSRYNASSAVSFLSDGVSEDDSALRLVSVEGLCVSAENGSKRGRKELRNQYKNSDPLVRAAAVACFRDLNKYHKYYGFYMAEKLVGDANPQVRLEVAHVVSQTAGIEERPDDVGKLLGILVNDSVRSVRLAALSGLRELGSDVPESIANKLALRFGNADTEEKLAVLDVASGFVNSKLLNAAMTDSSGDIRKAAVALAFTSKVGLGEVLSRALTDGDADVRGFALELLSQNPKSMANKAILQAVKAATGDSSPALQVGALAALSAAQPESAEEYFKPLVQSSSESERVVAAQAARQLAIKSPDLATKVIKPLARDSAHDVREAAFAALAVALTSQPNNLAKKTLTGSEGKPVMRFAASAALATKALVGDEEAASILAKVAKSGKPLAKIAAQAGQGAVDNKLSPIESISLFVP